MCHKSAKVVNRIGINSEIMVEPDEEQQQWQVEQLLAAIAFFLTLLHDSHLFTGWSVAQMMGSKKEAPSTDIIFRRCVKLPPELPELNFPLPQNEVFTYLAQTQAWARIVQYVWFRCLDGGWYRRMTGVDGSGELTQDQLLTKFGNLLATSARITSSKLDTLSMGVFRVGRYQIHAYRRVRENDDTRSGDMYYLFDGLVSNTLWVPVVFMAMKNLQVDAGQRPRRAHYRAMALVITMIHLSAGWEVDDEFASKFVKTPESYGVVWV